MSEKEKKLTPNDRLRSERQAHGWTQRDVADALGTTKLVVGRWERGERVPQRFYWKKLCELFGKSALELGLLTESVQEPARELLVDGASAASTLPLWNVPARRNPFFTGRIHILEQLHDALGRAHDTLFGRSYALSGLGGIGKTQTAIEYAYRYRDDYTAIFWISAETPESILSSLVAIATLLKLPEVQDLKQDGVQAAVIRWLISHDEWLLILDDVEDIELVKTILPPTQRGSLLFTSRQQALGFPAQTLALEPLTPEEGVQFLLYRARLKESLRLFDGEDEARAHEIVATMDGLPLALDQAAAYIEATRCRLSNYLHLLRLSPLRLLEERETHADHPVSVARTFALAFEQLKRSNEEAVLVLEACAFLAPEAIPEAFFLEGAILLGAEFGALATDLFVFNDAIKALLSYSLIQRDAAVQTLRIHRLVQDVLKAHLSEEDHRLWVMRVLRAMVHLFPLERGLADYWQTCERFLPHALACLGHAEKWQGDMRLRISLMSRVAAYLLNRARFAEAKALYEPALRIGEQALGENDLLVAEVLVGLALLAEKQGLYDQAEAFYKRALHIREQVLGRSHPLISEVLNRLGETYRLQGKHEQAEPLYLRALEIGEQALGPKAASVLNNLAILYWYQGKYAQAESIYLRALRIKEQILGPEHQEIASTLNNLGIVYVDQGKYQDAEPLFLRALHIREQGLGEEHPLVVYPLNNLAYLYRAQGRYEQAVSFFQRAIHIWELSLGLNHPDIAHPLCDLADVYTLQGRCEEAEPLLQRALQIVQQGLGLDHPLMACPLQGLAGLHTLQERFEQARPLYERALSLRRQHLHAQHPDVAETLSAFARFHHVQKQMKEALALYQQALAIRERTSGSDHPKTRETRIAYARLLQEMGQEGDAFQV